eukprot:6192050-Pleurochrysis_carterae.AAC.4
MLRADSKAIDARRQSTPRADQVYVGGCCRYDCLFESPLTTPVMLLNLPRVRKSQNKLAKKMEEPRSEPAPLNYAQTLRLAAELPDV